MGLSSLSLLGVGLSLLLVGFALVKIHRKTVEPAMAAALLGAAMVAPLAFGKIGSDFRATLPGGTTIETWVARAEGAAQATSADRKEVEAIASRLRDLETRFRRVMADSVALTYLSWLSRGQLGSIPGPTTNKLNALAQSMLAEGVPDVRDRDALVAEIEGLSPGFVRMKPSPGQFPYAQPTGPTPFGLRGFEN
ncbi:MAG: hypothetical protein HY271_12370 [Deltaproteobacteria bacterium]|nr:hypothetical protein [Deltaproteobacteria bacterium]